MDKTTWIHEDLIDLPEELIRTILDEDELEGMARSLQAVGQLQAILVKVKGERYELLDGLRRLTGLRMIKRKKVNCTIKTEDFQMTQAIALIANIQREDMPPLDEARVVRSIVDDHGWGIPRTAQHLGKPESWVRGRLDLNRLPPNLAARLQNNEIGIGVALELSRIPDERTRDTFAEYAAEGGCTLLQAQRWRNQAERDIQAGHLNAAPPPPQVNTEEKRQEVYNTDCGVCGRSFPGDRVRIIKACPVCFETIRQENEDAQPQNPDPIDPSGKPETNS